MHHHHVTGTDAKTFEVIAQGCACAELRFGRLHSAKVTGSAQGVNDRPVPLRLKDVI
jgi:hypothetical protein